MTQDLLRVEGNERVDLGDFQYQAGEGQVLQAAQTPAQFLTDPDGNRQWILDGFAIDNPVGDQIRVTKGRAILSRRRNGAVLHGMVTSIGDSEKIVDTSAFTAAVHGIYIRFDFVDGDLAGRVFWDAATPSEFSQNINTRIKANWSMRIEQTNPGGEWFKIGEVDLSVGPSSITDQRNLYFEGAVNTSYANTWGSGTDRDSNRAVNGIKDLQTFTAAMRQLFEDIKPSAARWWEKRGLDVQSDTADETGLIGRGAGPNGIGVEGFGIGTGSGVEGTGGPTNGVGVKGTGAGTGVGVEGVGGPTDATAILGTGGGTNGIGVQGVAAGGTGAGVTGTSGASGGSAGVKGTAISNSANVPGVLGENTVNGASAGPGVRGTNTNTAGGFGVEGNHTGGNPGAGVLGTSSTGYGVLAEGLATSPVRSALRVAPQNPDPSSGQKGDLYVNSITGKLLGYDGATWLRHRPQAFAMLSTTAPVGASSTAEIIIPQDYRISADTLRAGSTIRLRASGFINATGNPSLTFRGYISPAASPLTAAGRWLAFTATIPGFSLWALDVTITVRTVGVGVGIFSAGILSYTSPQVAHAIASIGATMTTTGDNDLELSIQFSLSNGGNFVEMSTFVVDIN